MRDQKRATLAEGKFVRFTPPVLQEIETLAAREKRTVSNAIRLLVEEALAARGSGRGTGRKEKAA